MYEPGDLISHTDTDGTVYEAEIKGVISRPALNQVLGVGESVTYTDPDGEKSEAKVVRINSNGPNGQNLSLKIGKKIIENVAKYDPHHAKAGYWEIRAQDVETANAESE